MTTRSLFATRLYEADVSGSVPILELADAIRSLSADDTAGRRWSKENGYSGYTSYASLDDLPVRDPRFGELSKLLTRHASTFARQCAFDLARKPKLDSLWVNLLTKSGHHSAHIHPHSMISGTLYVEVPAGSGPIRFEDPRLPSLMAAPPRRQDAPEDLQTFVAVEPRPGLLLLWESWLRHEVLPGKGRSERLSVSFNFS